MPRKAEEKDKELCPLYLGGSCPIFDEDDYEISYEKGMLINKQCCNKHREPTEEELKKWYSEKWNKR